MKVLVTGGNGFIGNRVCRELLLRGHDVTGLCHTHRDHLDALQRIGLGVEVGDVLDKVCLRAICAKQKIEGVCHLAVRPPQIKGGSATSRVNAEGTNCLLQACSDAGIGPLVFASSMSVYNFRSPSYLPVDEEHPLEPLQAYGGEKKKSETYCRIHAERKKMDIPILRLAGVCGPGKRAGAVYNFAPAILRGETVEIAENRSIDLVYVQDAATAVVGALEDAGALGLNILNIGAGRPISLETLAKLTAREAGLASRIDCGSKGDAFYLDISRAEKLLGYKPRSLQAGLEKFVPWVEEDIFEKAR